MTLRVPANPNHSIIDTGEHFVLHLAMSKQWSQPTDLILRSLRKPASRTHNLFLANTWDIFLLQ